MHGLKTSHPTVLAAHLQNCGASQNCKALPFACVTVRDSPVAPAQVVKQLMLFGTITQLEAPRAAQALQKSSFWHKSRWKVAKLLLPSLGHTQTNTHTHTIPVCGQLTFTELQSSPTHTGRWLMEHSSKFWPTPLANLEGIFECRDNIAVRKGSRRIRVW